VGLLRPLATALGLLLAWEALVRLTGVPPFILPGPGRVLAALVERRDLLLGHAAVTAGEILAGMVLGSLVGALAALLLAARAPPDAGSRRSWSRAKPCPSSRWPRSSSSGSATAPARRWRWRC
jgi:ABC-type nitrate/sulfonate/bicarbonate transport system permease component